MQGAVTDKWLPDVSPADRTLDVALRTLKGRLGALLYYLPLAAQKADEDQEYVHQLRVWTRRATAALRLYEDMLPRRRYSWLMKQLKRVRRAANDARDCDVLIERLRKKPPSRQVKRWLESTQSERIEAQTRIVAVHERLWRDDRFSHRIDKLLERVRARGEDNAGPAIDRFGDWARSRLRPMVERFFASIPDAQADEAALHQFRIRGKELRYAIEILAGAFADELRTQLYPAIEELQDRLGAINDLATARARLLRKIEETDDAKAVAGWRKLLVEEETHLEESRLEFEAWFTPLMIQDLREGFEREIKGVT